MLTQEKLKQYLRYDQRTGVFTNRVQRTSRSLAGQEAGSLTASGYVEIGLCGKRYYAHRLAWFYVHGEWPAQIDHKNGVRTDNRLCNLRAATNSTNAQNIGLRKTNTSGLTGAVWTRGKWRAIIKHKNKQQYLGSFDTAEKAHEAYKKAKAQLHTFQPTIRI